MTAWRVLVADDNTTNLEVLTRMLFLEKVHDVEVAMVNNPAWPTLRSLLFPRY